MVQIDVQIIRQTKKAIAFTAPWDGIAFGWLPKSQIVLHPQDQKLTEDGYIDVDLMEVKEWCWDANYAKFKKIKVEVA